jgi:hypothetical protein
MNRESSPAQAGVQPIKKIWVPAFAGTQARS